MAKFIMSLGDQTLRILTREAEKRNVKVQELLRAVIVPEWVKSNLDPSAESGLQKEVDSRTTLTSLYNALGREPMLQSSTDRGRRQRTNSLRSPPL